MDISIFSGWHEEHFGTERAFEMFSKAGFKALDYTLDEWNKAPKNSFYYGFSDSEMRSYYLGVKATADRFGLRIGQTHSVYGPFDATMSEEFFEAQKKNIYATHLLGCKYTVIHPPIMPERKYDAFEKENFDICIKYYSRLKPYLKEYGVKIGLEPMWNEDANYGKICPTIFSRPEEILRCLDVMGDECFCVCLDFGHINITGRDTSDTVWDAIEKFGDALEIIHAHDTDGFRDNHTAPFFGGNLNWEKSAAALGRIGYKGTFNFEVCGGFFEKFPDGIAQSALDFLCGCGKYYAGIADENRKDK